MAALVGPVRRLYVKVLAGMSLSVAVLVTISVVWPAIVRFGWNGRTGAVLISLTTTVKELVAERCWELTALVLVSVATVVITFVLGPVVSSVVQVIMPF